MNTRVFLLVAINSSEKVAFEAPDAPEEIALCDQLILKVIDERVTVTGRVWRGHILVIECECTLRTVQRLKETRVLRPIPELNTMSIGEVPWE